jgi:hypothetical protein
MKPACGKIEVIVVVSWAFPESDNGCFDRIIYLLSQVYNIIGKILGQAWAVLWQYMQVVVVYITYYTQCEILLI